MNVEFDLSWLKFFDSDLLYIDVYRKKLANLKFHEDGKKWV